MLTYIFIVLCFFAVWMFLSPCSPWSLWKNGSCAWKPKTPKPDTNQPKS